MCSLGTYEPLDAAAVSDWEFETDVVVIGHGGGGATAALEARRSGADVLVVEKTARGGGTTEQAGGYFYLGGGTPLQKRHGIEDSPDEMFAYLRARNPNTSPERIRAFVEESRDIYDWIEALGLVFEGPLITEKTMEPPESHLGFTGSEECYPYRLITPPAPRGHQIEEGGRKLFERLDEAAREAGVEFLFETAAQRLVFDHHRRRVVGIQATTDESERLIRARNGVVIATSGFSYNEEMVREYAPAYPDKGTPLGTYFVQYPGEQIHDGSGINMAVAVGAKTMNMEKILAVGFVYPYDVYPPGDGSLNRALVSGILVNARGRRFINEDRYGCDISRTIVEQEHAEEIPGNPASAHLLLDDDLFQAGGGAAPREVVNFDPSTLVSADSLTDLARKLDLPVAVLEDTVAFYNDHARENRDPEFHKHESFVTPLDTPPYHAYFLRPRAFSGGGIFYHTLGGLKVSLDGAVINSSDEPIAGLYGASQAIDGITGENYESGMSLVENIFFGRRAGRAVAGDSNP